MKESDRIATVDALLARLGVGVETAADAPRRSGAGARARPGSTSHGDHRIAMAGGDRRRTRPTGESVVDGWRAIAVSYPEFTDDL